MEHQIISCRVHLKFFNFLFTSYNHKGYGPYLTVHSSNLGLSYTIQHYPEPQRAYQHIPGAP